MGPLVTPDWLAARLGDTALRVVDASWHLPTAGRNAQAEYLAEHIPGALFWDLEAMSATGDPLPHMMPPAAQFAGALGSLGIGSGDRVVAYDTSGTNFSAARAWWQLRAVGHREVAVLDGGLGGWKAAGLTMATGEEPRPSTTNYPTPSAIRGFRSRREVLALLDHPEAQLADARSAGRFAGREPEPRPGVRSGHIPGSRNLPIALLVDDQGRLLPEGQLRAVFRQAQVDPDRPVVACCGSGVTACAIVLALECLGLQDHAVYDGSWTEWGGDADLPVETD
jgi:thiosulfate/3-mercaptopyruvate sulfurtransferase